MSYLAEEQPSLIAYLENYFNNIGPTAAQAPAAQAPAAQAPAAQFDQSLLDEAIAHAFNRDYNPTPMARSSQRLYQEASRPDYSPYSLLNSMQNMQTVRPRGDLDIPLHPYIQHVLGGGA